MTDSKTNDQTALSNLSSGVASSDLPEGATILRKVEGKDVLLARVRGKVYAVGATCTHLGGPLAKGLLVENEIRCPWHHARFAIETGEAVGAPAFDPLPCFNVEEHDGRIVVTGRRPGATQAQTVASPPERIVILGGGAAGFACAEMLTRSGFGKRVTILSADADPPYDRTFCSKAYLLGDASRDDCLLVRDGFFDAGGPTLVHERAVKTDLDVREIATEGGARYAFDALVIATGAESKRPDLPGLDSSSVFTLRTLHDADAIIAAAQSYRRAAVLGASFIGLEVAASLIGRGVKVDVIAPDDVPLAPVLGSKIGAIVQSEHEKNGVRFHLGRKAERFEDGQLVLDNGSKVKADFVVAGIGVAPRVDLAREVGLDMSPEDAGSGIAVNACLETSIPGIFAVGDVASYPDPFSGGKRIRVEHWVHAQRQGQHVARVMMGEAKAFSDVPFFWTAHFDTKLRYVGHVAKIKELEVDGDIDEQIFTARINGEDGCEAFVTCNRDQSALKEEARLEAAHPRDLTAASPA